jgi:hypothetical protein
MISLRQLIWQELRQEISEVMPELLPRLLIKEHLKLCNGRYDADYASNVGFLCSELDLVNLRNHLQSRLDTSLGNCLVNVDLDPSQLDDHLDISLIKVRLYRQKWLNFEIHWHLIGYWLWYMIPLMDLSTDAVNVDNMGELSWATVYGFNRSLAVIEQLTAYDGFRGDELSNSIPKQFLDAIAIMEKQQQMESQGNYLKSNRKNILGLFRHLGLLLIYLGDMVCDGGELLRYKTADRLANSFLAVHDQVAILGLSVTERWWYWLLAQRVSGCLAALGPEVQAYRSL